MTTLAMNNRRSNHIIVLSFSMSAIILGVFQMSHSAAGALLGGLGYLMIYTLLFFKPGLIYVYEVPQKLNRLGLVLISALRSFASKVADLIKYILAIEYRRIFKSMTAPVFHWITSSVSILFEGSKKYVFIPLRKLIRREMRYAKYDFMKLVNFITRAFKR